MVFPKLGGPVRLTRRLSTELFSRVLEDDWELATLFQDVLAIHDYFVWTSAKGIRCPLKEPSSRGVSALSQKD